MTWHAVVKKKNKVYLNQTLLSSNDNWFSTFCHKENKKYYIGVIMSEGKGEPTVKLTKSVQDSSTSGNKHMIPAKQKLQIM
jgi:hypothetical protein